MLAVKENSEQVLAQYERFAVHVIRLHGRRCGKSRRKIHEYPYEYKTYRVRASCAMYGALAHTGIHLHEEGLRTICQEAVPGLRSEATPMFFPIAVFPIRDFPPREIFHFLFRIKSRFDLRRGD